MLEKHLWGWFLNDQLYFTYVFYFHPFFAKCISGKQYLVNTLRKIQLATKIGGFNYFLDLTCVTILVEAYFYDSKGEFSFHVYVCAWIYMYIVV